MVRWTVVGGGPCGIASVGRLVDLGYHVIWIDPTFSTGRLGKYYRNIPANTPTNDLIYALNLCKSFQFQKYQRLRESKGIHTISQGMVDSTNVYVIPSTKNNEDLGDNCMDLKYFCEALDDITEVLLSNNLVQSYKGIVTNLTKLENWELKISLKNSEFINITSDAVILTCGSIPISYNVNSGNVTIHSLDEVVDCKKVKTYVNSNIDSLNDVWCVVGSSHSAMLVLKNLFDNNITNIVNIYRSDFRYQIKTEEETIYPGVGLKGPIGEWTKTVFNKINSINRIKYDEKISWDSYVHKYNIKHLIYAVGFQPNIIKNNNDYKIDFDEPSFPIIKIGDYEIDYNILNKYDILTGELGNFGDLFGGGIAFPQHYFYKNNTSEPWIGFKRSIEQIDLMINVYNKSHKL